MTSSPETAPLPPCPACSLPMDAERHRCPVAAKGSGPCRHLGDLVSEPVTEAHLAPAQRCAECGEVVIEGFRLVPYDGEVQAW